MNFILRFLLQLPLTFVLFSGVQEVFGWTEWWITLPIGMVLLFLYDFGELIKNEEKNED
jgi:hypothetical protein